MMIFNGETKTLVVFGDAQQADVTKFLTEIMQASAKHIADGRPLSGGTQ